MDQAYDRPGTETCAKWTLGGFTRTGLLLMGAVLACILTIDLPIPTGRVAADGQGAAQPYVPASGNWIELGPSGDGAAAQPNPLAAEVLQRAAAAEPALAPAHQEQQRAERRRAG